MGRVSAAHLLVRTLRMHGIDRLFGLCGDHVNPIFNACVDEGVAIVDTRHESAAAHMADAWARVMGTPGVSVVTGGPGHTNSVTGIATAWLAGSPILAISGQYESGLGERGAAQDVDQVYNRTAGVELGAIRYDRVVEAMGGHGAHVTRPADLRPAIERAAKAGTVACINVGMRGVPSPLTVANIARHRRSS